MNGKRLEFVTNTQMSPESPDDKDEASAPLEFPEKLFTVFASLEAAMQRFIGEGTTVSKLCEGCDRLVAPRVVVCPHCRGYRFSEDPARIAEQRLRQREVSDPL